MAEENESSAVAATSLFVELVIIGSGTATAVAVGLAARVGWGWLEPLSKAGPLSVGILAYVYLLGILTDRLADALGKPLSVRWRSSVYSVGASGSRDYGADLLAVLRHGPLASRLSYGRSRLRVCRGWTLNGAFGAAALLAYVLMLPDGQPRAGLGWGVGLSLTALTVASFLAWRSLALSQYRQVHAQAPTLVAAQTTPPA